MRNDEIMVSVICAAYNHERYIRQAVEGFLMQKTDFRYEVLINDDASTDNTASILQEYEAKYPEILKITYQKENLHRQKISAVSFLMSKAVGKYIALCEGDDFWIDENKLQLQVEYMEANPECSLCAHAAYNSYENGVIKSNLFKPFDCDTDLTSKEVIAHWLFPTASIMYKRSLMPGVIPFRGNAPCGDYPIVVYMSTLGSIHYIDRIMSVYRNGSISSVNRGLDNEASAKRYKLLIELGQRIDEYTDYKFSQSVLTFQVANEYFRLMALSDSSESRKSNLYKYFSFKQKLKLFINSHFKFIMKLFRKIQSHRQVSEYKKCLKNMNNKEIKNVSILSEII